MCFPLSFREQGFRTPVVLRYEADYWAYWGGGRAGGSAWWLLAVATGRKIDENTKRQGGALAPPTPYPVAACGPSLPVVLTGLLLPLAPWHPSVLVLLAAGSAPTSPSTHLALITLLPRVTPPAKQRRFVSLYRPRVRVKVLDLVKALILLTRQENP